MAESGLVQKIWRIIFPILLYEVLSMLYPEFLRIVLGERQSEPTLAMWFLAIENLLMLPVFWLLYQRERRKHGRKASFGGKDVFCVILGSLCISRGINYFLAITFLPELFPGYRAVSEEIYDCGLWSQIAATVVSAPLLEEVLMRGLVYERLKEAAGNVRMAMITSALIFGLFHGNVVQGIYAFAMGLFFVQVYEACGSLALAVLAHIAANTVSVLAGQYSWTGRLNGIPGVYYLVTACFLMAGLFCWRYFWLRNGERG